ncbi:hypothetical protein BDZ94DRAFT_163579 [Collybia nuda]|uniref:Uncharacterized protein n=1 Tax=Collybia nuda TaxID=64659 RepID=A0A9P5XW97_9AGAR|nr:hypothetical protein BDZ94DRAFT_163579 [Collybia nuda]
MVSATEHATLPWMGSIPAVYVGALQPWVIRLPLKRWNITRRTFLFDFNHEVQSSSYQKNFICWKCDVKKRFSESSFRSYFGQLQV